VPTPHILARKAPPYFAIVVRDLDRSPADRTYCIGTLLTTDFVITAESCTNKQTRFEINLGLYDSGEWVGWEYKHVMEAPPVYYTRPTTFHGQQKAMALIRLNPPATFSPHIQPVSLISPNSISVGEEVHVATFRFVQNQPLGQWLAMRVANDSECKTRFPNFDAEDTICAAVIGSTAECRTFGAGLIGGHDENSLLAVVVDQTDCGTQFSLFQKMDIVDFFGTCTNALAGIH